MAAEELVNIITDALKYYRIERVEDAKPSWPTIPRGHGSGPT